MIFFWISRLCVSFSRFMYSHDLGCPGLLIGSGIFNGLNNSWGRELKTEMKAEFSKHSHKTFIFASNLYAQDRQPFKSLGDWKAQEEVPDIWSLNLHTVTKRWFGVPVVASAEKCSFVHVKSGTICLFMYLLSLDTPIYAIILSNFYHSIMGKMANA